MLKVELFGKSFQKVSTGWQVWPCSMLGSAARMHTAWWGAAVASLCLRLQFYQADCRRAIATWTQRSRNLLPRVCTCQANPSAKRVNRHFSRTPFKYHTNHRLINTAPSLSKLRAYPDEMKCRGTACTVCAAPRSLFPGFLARQSSVISSRSVGTKSHARTQKTKTERCATYKCALLAFRTLQYRSVASSR